MFKDILINVKHLFVTVENLCWIEPPCDAAVSATVKW